ncbi:MAG: GNAT family N-acetyltransferase [Deltaproteobacteria bacterium]|nr:GNAT family N-acetyltransferase [Deltaproteobacteria bacterium]
MAFRIDPLSLADRWAVVDIFNYYVENTFAAFPEDRVTDEFFDWLFRLSKGYTALAAKDKNGRVIGFGLLRSHSPVPTLSRTAEISYFILPEYTRKGIGRAFLEKLVEEAKTKKLTSLLACISSLNDGSIAFHQKNGFVECGCFRGIGIKKEKVFDVLWMQKML